MIGPHEQTSASACHMLHFYNQGNEDPFVGSSAHSSPWSSHEDAVLQCRQGRERTRVTRSTIPRAASPSRAVEVKGVSDSRTWETGRVYLSAFFHVLQLEFVKCLDMVACESNRDEDHLLLSKTRKSLDSFTGLHTHPCRRPNLGLPHQTIGVRMPQSIHDSVHRSRHFKNIRVPTVDH